MSTTFLVPKLPSTGDEEKRQLVADARARWTQTDVAGFELGGLFFVVRGPSREEFKRFRVAAVAVQSRAAAQEVLVLECVLYPSGEQMEGILNRKPGLIDALSEALMELGGGGEAAKKKDW